MLKVEFKNEIATVIDTMDNQIDLDINDILQLIPLLTKIVEEKFSAYNKQSVPCKCSRTYLALNGFNKICLDCGKVQ